MAKKRKPLSPKQVRAQRRRIDAVLNTTVDAQNEIFERLQALAEVRMRSLTWCGERKGTPPGGHDAEDLVHEAFIALYKGKRRWRNCDNFLKAVEQVICSKISNLVRKKENRTVRRPVQMPETERPTPTTNHIDVAEELHKRLEQLDEFTRAVALFFLEAPSGTKYTAAAKALGVSYFQFYRAVQRLREALSDLLGQPQSYTSSEEGLKT